MNKAAMCKCSDAIMGAMVGCPVHDPVIALSTQSKAAIHRSKFGTYHPSPSSSVAWTVNDTRGYIDGGPACEECGACECERCSCGNCDGTAPYHACDSSPEDSECIGLSFAYICLDGGDALCRECFEKDDTVDVIDCDCA
jgi:hypothetical protein